MFCIGLLSAPLAIAAEPDAALTPEQEAFFESKVRPLLVAHCYDCHSAEAGESSGDLRLDSATWSRKGGATGPAVVPGNIDASLLMVAVRYDNAELQMPPEGKLEAAEIETLRQWIEQGAPDPRTDSGDDVESMSPMDIDPSSHWAYVAPKRAQSPELPHPEDRDVIDSLARELASQAELTVGEPVSDAQLIRRLYYDLVGIPPTAEQVNRYVESDDETKRERLIESLLAAPDFGERFARYWMDVARYADTIGYTLAGKERRLKGSERYRDWLVQAYGSDMPFDEMVRLQLAADRFDPNNEAGNLDALGFITIGRRYLNGFDTIDDRIDVVSRGLLGMTVACARCHDHKFDPIPASDYYSLLGIIESSETKEDGPSPLMMVDKSDPHDSQIFIRGQPGNRGEVAPRQYLTALRSDDDQPFRDGSGRLELAERLADPNNPLVARVFVNRIWMKLIGRPFVDSTSDFGVRTAAPPSVEILDELASEFVTHFSVKRLVRRIVNSRVYAQSAVVTNAKTIEIDPDNRYLARGNRRRRDFESLRDSMTWVSGQLDRQLGGEPVEIHKTNPISRRTLYAMIDRQNLPSLFRTFDVASPDSHAPKRFQTTVPQQALFLMNHPQVGVLSHRLGEQISQSTIDPLEQVGHAFRRIYSREPSTVEAQAAVAFLARPVVELEPEFDSRLAWRYGTALINKDGSFEPFEALNRFVGATWQDAETLPSSSELAYASLGKDNGHPGRRHAVVKRWIAPANGTVSIRGMIRHPNDQGDGVELSIWIGDQLLRRIVQHDGEQSFDDLQGTVAAGQAVDFMIAPRSSDSFDSFNFNSHIELIGDNNQTFVADSSGDFSGPLTAESVEPLDRLGQLIQALMISNEFAFVD
ncbi:PSD1 and planctomycete cytochrome C domain-containing protein [Rhodopirellula sp. MGV]|uniref:PSD1 and planctomycete cytochrome C domain-containing protein n=1 Tax=Rhodopirellula sp. MGV TaxID=2023130 RepID=UPI001E4FF42A|nr:PSD1 and planctomycete cytochrome C domain-containing protein [Rhodopirellula sp. MGV]